MSTAQHLRSTRLLVHAVDDEIVAWVQCPVRIAPSSEPEPDIALLAPSAGNYSAALPGPSEVLLVVEVPPSTLNTDRLTKLPLYARAGIHQAWLVDLAAGTVEDHLLPGPGGYRQVTVLRPGQHLAAAALPAVEVDIGAVFDI